MAGALVMGPGIALAEQVTVEVEAVIFSIFAPGVGEIESVDDVNGTAVDLTLEDTIRAIVTYESDTLPGLAVEGDPQQGDVADSAFYGMLFGPTPILRMEFYKGSELFMSTDEALPLFTGAIVNDSFTPGILDSVSWFVSFPEPPPQLDGWGVQLFVEEPGDLGTVDLPNPLPETGWRILSDPASQQWSWAWGVVPTASTSAAHAQFDAYITAVRVGSGNVVEGDLNGDRLLDVSDFHLFAASFARCEGDLGFIPAADFDGNGCVTFDDYQIFQTFYSFFE